MAPINWKAIDGHVVVVVVDSNTNDERVIDLDLWSYSAASC